MPGVPSIFIFLILMLDISRCLDVDYHLVASLAVPSTLMYLSLCWNDQHKELMIDTKI